MKFIVIQESKNKLVFTLEGETHTFCNILKEELRKIKEVKVAAYSIDHPLIGKPEFQIETSGMEPRKALKEALASLKQKAKEFKKEIGKI